MDKDIFNPQINIILQADIIQLIFSYFTFRSLHDHQVFLVCKTWNKTWNECCLNINWWIHHGKTHFMRDDVFRFHVQVMDKNVKILTEILKYHNLISIYIHYHDHIYWRKLRRPDINDLKRNDRNVFEEIFHTLKYSGIILIDIYYEFLNMCKNDKYDPFLCNALIVLAENWRKFGADFVCKILRNPPLNMLIIADGLRELLYNGFSPDLLLANCQSFAPYNYSIGYYMVIKNPRKHILRVIYRVLLNKYLHDNIDISIVEKYYRLCTYQTVSETYLRSLNDNMHMAEIISMIRRNKDVHPLKEIYHPEYRGWKKIDARIRLRYDLY